MRWEKLGLVFDLARLNWDGRALEFAQSPQTLVLDERVRVYFSTRSREPNGMFLSHIAYAEFDRELKTLLDVSSHTVFPLGQLGCFDEHGIFPINVFPYSDAIYAFTCGWSRRVSVPVETAIGLAISRDGGVTFERMGSGPILGPSLQQPFLVGDPFVGVFKGAWHMWYIYGARWVANPREPSPARVYKIAHATSGDGKTWVREDTTPISDVLDSDECQALPSVIEIDGRYHMVFCFRHATDFRTNKDRGYRLGYAWSEDLRQWTREDRTLGIGPSHDGWDSEMMCYPNLFRCSGHVYLLYNGNEFGRYGFGAARLVG